MIVRELQRIQAEFGYLPREKLAAVAKALTIPLYRVQEVASFFPHFRSSPPADVEVQVCRDMSCRLRGSQGLLQELQTFAEGKQNVHVEGVSCLGRCDRAPACQIHGHR